MVERKRLTSEQYEKQIAAVKKVAELTAQIKEILPQFEGKSVYAAYENSVKNLETKNEKYSKERAASISDEDKEILRKFHAGEITFAPTTEKENEVSTRRDTDSEPAHSKKGKRTN